jgi:chromosome segregation ATPase
MATSESPARLSRKVKKNEEDIQAHSDDIVKILGILQGHTVDLMGIDAKVSSIDAKVSSVDAKVSSVDATVSAIDSRVDKLEGGQASLRLQVGSLTADVKTVDGRLVRVERSMSRHGELLEEILGRLAPADS